LKVSNKYGFQLNDTCSDWVPGTSAYNPSCDPCCQPMLADGKPLRPTYCYPYVDTVTGETPYPEVCFGNPKATDTSGNSICPCSDPASTDARCTTAPLQCSTNNPYGLPYIYDSSYQEFANQQSFLDKYGRDLQKIPSASVMPLTNLTVLGNFPNGVFPFFWLMKDYSPEVDNIDPTSPTGLTSSQYHWCASPNPSAPAAPPGFEDLTQLGLNNFTLPYTCSGQDCCVNSLMDSTTTGNAATNSNLIHITVGSRPTIVLNAITPSSFTIGTAVGDPETDIPVSGYASEPSPGVISTIGITFSNASTGGSITTAIDTTGFTLTPSTAGGIYTLTFSGTIPVPLPPCTSAGTTIPTGSYQIIATATDDHAVTTSTGTNDPATVAITNPGSCPAGSCGQDVCGNDCLPGCTGPGQTCSTSAPKTFGTCSCPNTCGGSTCGTDPCGNHCGGNGGNCASGTCSTGGPAGLPGTCA
jgi:hypothetical protein